MARQKTFTYVWPDGTSTKYTLTMNRRRWFKVPFFIQSMIKEAHKRGIQLLNLPSYDIEGQGTTHTVVRFERKV